VIDFDTSFGIAEITAYLKVMGWGIAEAGPLAQIWDHRSAHEQQIFLPLRETANDFEKRVRMLVADLSRFERRAPEEIKQEISCVFYDVTDLEASHPSQINGSIPLHAAERLFLAARKMVEASAAATIQRQAHYGHQMPDRAREHARHVRAGHTKEGSYILPIISRARAAPDITIENERPQYLVDVEETLFDRRVMTTMAKALEALELIAVRSDRRPSGTEIIDVIGEGVSRELCKCSKCDFIARSR
jgi:hypothetical protein